jgi:hypothetical protein
VIEIPHLIIKIDVHRLALLKIMGQKLTRGNYGERKKIRGFILKMEEGV